MITVNGWCAGRKGGGGSEWGGVSVLSMGKDFCPNFLKPFLEKIDRRSCNDGSRELIPVFHNPLRLEYLVGVPSWAASSRREEKQVRINIQKALEYLEGGNQVSPKSSPLQGMKAQPLQSLFIEELLVTNLVANL